MMYTAVHLCPDGGVIRHPDTQEVANIQIGDFDSMDDAIQQACLDLKCTQMHNGTLTKGYGKGGFMVVPTQELEAV
ncbi:hypothetical protein CSW98_15970 [Vibrio sp. HA2012]|uniref:hypothetical protein n=1 Tax=Vibrio sp. HA2012 TaxID=1971595 RepID=UPI000C2C5CEE|nr:hypothetical protein [Vibrio sp. HA2012]PJC85323.1 hypothetical protein CSW98_15970 [Vibrio sp. HA2012]